MEIYDILRCNKCLVTHRDFRITHIDDEGNLYCARCAAYLNKVGGYDLNNFNAEEFIKTFEREGD
ncbi:hypothetical protein SAMN00017405_2326 [Desulfonispora thiosulfatigenes DSM 11270]|uniref:Uncharacterized protein n=1 Tax=Desulfonispora thiosulfatigenes DSM 11270 TaxID=656914 RepID=A0A1W1VT93_DESTI|nr:hypothetical protein [Desulfonispora thiosulfatigenes]SMB96578.1 hypothetical protein SAMN00017405_2326 [Desulfonispora thiosulfatigenes DSM 11270]